jgi:hypothetical protein
LFVCCCSQGSQNIPKRGCQVVTGVTNHHYWRLFYISKRVSEFFPRVPSDNLKKSRRGRDKPPLSEAVQPCLSGTRDVFVTTSFERRSKVSSMAQPQQIKDTRAGVTTWCKIPCTKILLSNSFS